MTSGVVSHAVHILRRALVFCRGTNFSGYYRGMRWQLGDVLIDVTRMSLKENTVYALVTWSGYGMRQWQVGDPNFSFSSIKNSRETAVENTAVSSHRSWAWEPPGHVRVLFCSVTSESLGFSLGS